MSDRGSQKRLHTAAVSRTPIGLFSANNWFSLSDDGKTGWKIALLGEAGRVR